MYKNRPPEDLPSQLKIKYVLFVLGLLKTALKKSGKEKFVTSLRCRGISLK
jgi:hypothetical protein